MSRQQTTPGTNRGHEICSAFRRRERAQLCVDLRERFRRQPRLRKPGHLPQRHGGGHLQRGIFRILGKNRSRTATASGAARSVFILSSTVYVTLLSSLSPNGGGQNSQKICDFVVIIHKYASVVKSHASARVCTAPRRSAVAAQPGSMHKKCPSAGLTGGWTLRYWKERHRCLQKRDTLSRVSFSVIPQHYRFSNPRPENHDVRNDASIFIAVSPYHQPPQAAATCDLPSAPSSD